MKQLIIHTDKYVHNLNSFLRVYVTGKCDSYSKVGEHLADEKVSTIFEGNIPSVSVTKRKFDECCDALEFYSQFENYDTSWYEERLKKYSEDPENNYAAVYVNDDISEELISLIKERAGEYCSKVGVKMNRIEILEAGEQPTFDIVVETPSTLKVKVYAYKDYIIAETVDPEKRDGDFVPAGDGNIGCVLMNLDRLGVSEEARALLKNIKRGSDGIGDFTWDTNSFSWVGGMTKIQHFSKAISSRHHKLTTAVTIENAPSQESINEVENLIAEKEKGPIEIEYKDVKFTPWLEFSLKEKKYSIKMNFLEAHFYDGETILNAPDKVVKQYRDSFDVKMHKNDRERIAEALRKALGFPPEKKRSVAKDEETEKLMKRLDEQFEELGSFFDRGEKKLLEKINEEQITSVIDNFFKAGFDNNIMNPRMDYFRLSIDPMTVDQYIEKLQKV